MRIRIRLNDESFRYDVHSLLGSFFPGAELCFEIPEAVQKDPSETSSGCALRNVSSGCSCTATEATPYYNYLITISVTDSRIRVLTSASQRETLIPDGTARPAVKNLLKRTIYDAVSSDTGKILPWGTLSGIRPVKIAMQPLLAGVPEEEVRRIYRETYYVSERKTDLAVGIARREIREIEKAGIGPEDFSLYVSVPFCPTICSYCTFPSGTIGEYRDAVPAYLEALKRELAAVAGMTEGRRPVTLYVGGGTPTALAPQQLREILWTVRDLFDCSALAEITVEAGRPDTISEEHLSMLRECGTTRISVNPQTMQEKTLERIGRRHTPEDTVRAFELARQAGFDDINMDLILGLPGEDAEDIRSTLEQVAALGPEALTVHSLARKRTSRITQTGEEAGTLTGEMMDRVIGFAVSRGLLPYYLYRQKNIAGNLENIGFAKEGRAGLYNILMMEEIHTVMAAGAGSITKIVAGNGRKPVRAANVSDIRQYIERLPEMIKRKQDAYC